ncbi:MAG: 30S ribosomal protein S1 [Fimbriimonadaceae bacterium]
MEPLTDLRMTIDESKTPVSEPEAHKPADAGMAPATAEPEHPAHDLAPEASAFADDVRPAAEPDVSVVAEHSPDQPPAPAPHAEPEATAVAEGDVVVEPSSTPEPEVPVAIAEPAAVEPALPEAPIAAAPDDVPASDVASPEPTRPEPDITPPAPAEAAPVVVTPAAKAVREASDADLFDSYMNALDGEGADSDATYKKLSKGERIEATIIQVDKDRVFVDLGTKSEGIVPLGELSEENLDTAHGHFKVGDKINVVVIRPEGAEGNPIVSKKRADFEEVWDRIEDALKTGVMLTAQVVDRVKGGLVVDVGVRGFVPATHVGSGKLRNIEKYVGQPLQLKVIEIDRERKKVVLSNRQAEEERRASAKEDIFKNVHPGDSLEGTVRRLTDYGAFVDLGGVDGLLHISEMSWMRINHPREMFREGQKIKVMVLRLDQAAGKISLGHRQVLPDPWNLIKQNYTIGQKLTVKIGRLVQSGAFIKLPEGAEAFMPISEMSYRRIRRPDEAVEENQELEVQIIDLRTEERRMVLSLRALGGGDSGRPREGGGGPPSFEDEMRGKGGPKGKKGAKKGRGGRDDFEDYEDVAGRRGYATGGATIGERLGMLKGFLGRDEDDEDAEVTADVDTAEVDASEPVSPTVAEAPHPVAHEEEV